MIDMEWTEADQRHALHFCREAQASLGDPVSASAVLATAAFWVLSQQVGISGAAKTLGMIAEATQRRFSEGAIGQDADADGEFILRKVEILSGYSDGRPDDPKWFVNHHYTDGSQSIVDDKPTHAEAFASALDSASEDGIIVPIHDNCTVR